MPNEATQAKIDEWREAVNRLKAMSENEAGYEVLRLRVERLKTELGNCGVLDACCNLTPAAEERGFVLAPA